ncbi:hypothetical protein NEF87_004822 [Candidatus Lokiarchaeum ossiferum]|uniref:Prenyltransferase n=1 Tax=Candidatus Lokiarchaeum ossiferum TaxID=2951803 RepID=A0ABY6I089_9ARCH|nr:hypothetical protein NEF87_004822 [Candidatus Lokiarchaeum sp. B-35]
MSPKKISPDKMEEISHFFFNSAREIEKAQFKFTFLNGSANSVCKALEQYQNADGGFGHGLEPDFRLPLSSPMATSIGLRILDSLPESPKKREMISKTSDFLFDSYNPARKGWFAIRSEVNNYPHAPWWKYDPDINMTIIDKNWGNPSAEILAYLLKYKTLISPNMHKIIPDCVEKAINNIVNKVEFGSENEIFCYLHLFPILDVEDQETIRAKLSLAINKLVILDDSQWNRYVPQPLEFFPSPSNERFSFPEEHISHNLDFLIEKLYKFGHFSPTWNFDYPSDMKSVPDEWSGQLTLKYLKILKNYGRIEF